MVYPTGGFTTIRHNEIRDLTASLLTEVCHNVAIEPCLHPFFPSTVLLMLRMVLVARGFWTAHQDAFFDVRIFYPIASLYHFANMSNLRSRNTVNMCKKLCMEYLPLWCSPLLVVWHVKQLFFTSGWLTLKVLSGRKVF